MTVALDAAPCVLSVVIPSFNCAPFLERAVTSVFALDVDQVEVLIVDDGSQDETPSIGARLSASHPQVRYLHKTNGGLSSARNFGIAHAHGQYILLLDADDELLPCTLLPALATGADMVRVGVEEVAEGLPVIQHHAPALHCSGPDYLRAQFAAQSFFTPSWAYLYRRDWLLQHGLLFTPGLLHEDTLFTVEALLLARNFVTLPEAVYRYIRRQGSITSSRDRKRLLARVDAFLFVARRMTRLAAEHRDVDFRWWIDDLIHNAAALAFQHGRWHDVARVALAQIRCMAVYRGVGGHGLRYGQRRRLKSILRGLVQGSHGG